MLPVGFHEVEIQKWNPNYKYGDPYATRYLKTLTGDLECDDCKYRTPTVNPDPIHTCPLLKDGEGNFFTIGDTVYVFAKGRIRKGKVTRYKKETGMLTVATEDKNGVESKHVINHLGKVLRINEEV